MQVRGIGIGVVAVLALAGCRGNGGKPAERSGSPGYGDAEKASLPKEDADRRDLKGNDAQKTGSESAAEIQKTSGHDAASEEYRVSQVSYKTRQVFLSPATPKPGARAADEHGDQIFSFDEFQKLGGTDPALLGADNVVHVQKDADGNIIAVH